MRTCTRQGLSCTYLCIAIGYTCTVNLWCNFLLKCTMCNCTLGCKAITCSTERSTRGRNTAKTPVTSRQGIAVVWSTAPSWSLCRLVLLSHYGSMWSWKLLMHAIAQYQYQTSLIIVSSASCEDTGKLNTLGTCWAKIIYQSNWVTSCQWAYTPAFKRDNVATVGIWSGRFGCEGLRQLNDWRIQWEACMFK